MYKIKQIRIIGMWGIKDIDLDLNSDINFLIGRNGSGKTTILNILTSTLNLNLIDIDNLDFKKIEVILIKGKKRKKISLEKNYKQEREIIYRISNTTYNLSERVIREYLRWRGTSHIVYNNRANLDKLQTELKEIIDINLLDTNRLTKNNRDIFEREGYEEYRYERMRNILNPINIKLNFLIKELKTYKLTLKAKLETLTADFQRKVLELLIYNEDSDNIEDDKIDYNMINQIENDLEDFYKEFNYNRKDINKQIANHTSILKNEIKKKSLKEDYKTNLALLTRTKKVLEIVKELKKEKDKILFPINLYLEKLNLFMNEKKYSISEDGELKINLSKNDKEIRLEELSSGEKQIIILLTETLLQKIKQIFL